MSSTDDRADDGGGLIEYIGGTDRYYVVLLLDGVEIARRGPYRDRGDDMMEKFLVQQAKNEARKARASSHAFQRSEDGTRGVGRPSHAQFARSKIPSSMPSYTPPHTPPVRTKEGASEGERSRTLLRTHAGRSYSKGAV